MSNVSNVTATKPKVGGCLYVAPLGSTLPTDSTTALDNAFKSLGYISEDGIKNNNSGSSSNVKAFGGDVVASFQGEKNDEFSYTLIEVMNEAVLKEVYGDDNVSKDTNGNLTIYATNEEAKAHAYVFEFVLRDGRAKRIVIPNAKLTSVGEITYADEDLVGYECTLTSFSHTVGNKTFTHQEFIEKPKA